MSVETEADELDPREAEWVKWMAGMREVDVAFAEALDEELAA